MTTIARRGFLGAAAGLCAGARLLRADPLGMPAGCQVFPVRKQLVADLDGTLRELAAAGYQVIEFCSPPGFVKMDFAPLIGMKASELLARITAAGLRVTSCHYQFGELKEHAAERIAFAGELGLKQMVVATLAVPRDAPMDAWQRAAHEMNRLGDETRRAGIQLGFHNHNFEFQKIGGVVIFDELMRIFDPKLVKSQFQVSVISMGVDPAAVLAQYPGRFLSLHLQDWSAGTKKQAAVGQGSIDWKKLFTAAKKSGAEYYFVEMNMDLLKASCPYLKALRM